MSESKLLSSVASSEESGAGAPTVTLKQSKLAVAIEIASFELTLNFQGTPSDSWYCARHRPMRYRANIRIANETPSIREPMQRLSCAVLPGSPTARGSHRARACR